MFPITHIWFSRRVLGYINDMTVLGSIFPDAVKGCLTYDQTHNIGWGLHEYLREYEEEEYLDFARGVYTHTVNPRGLDFYSDEEYGCGYKGYCFQKAAPIEKEVVDACNIPDSFGLWKAHNFIEMGIEMNILEEEGELAGVFHKRLTDNAMVRELFSRLDMYYDLEDGSVSGCLDRFSGLMKIEDLSCRALANRYNNQMQLRHGIRINIPECSDIIEKSRSMVQEDFKGFIDFCTLKVKDMLKEEEA